MPEKHLTSSYALKDAIGRFNEIVDLVEGRCMAADGDVTPTLQEMREAELAELWRCIQVIRTAKVRLVDLADPMQDAKRRQLRRDGFDV